MDLSNENVVHVKSKGIEYLQFRKLLEYPEIKYAYVIGLDKNFEFYPSNEEKNKITKNNFKEICDELNLKYNNLVNVKQNHTDNIQIINKKINIDEPDFNLYENTDGLITNKEGIVLSTKNADCILLVFYDPIKKLIANVHSGWRGTLQRISVKAVEKMRQEYGCNPEDIICCMSPSIGKDHFEVGEDVYKMFYEEFKDLNDLENLKHSSILKNSGNVKILDDIFEQNGDKWHIDTILINRMLLLKQGLKEDNIIDSGICSVCNKNVIHSYRAHGEKAGRATQIIAMI
ncbi:MAG: peptidoglycan editing factor PgeF [Clostridia bacterium]|nr:peptidoglycan editing factor PgeF [Clostridia bacterium]